MQDYRDKVLHAINLVVYVSLGKNHDIDITSTDSMPFLSYTMEDRPLLSCLSELPSSCQCDKKHEPIKGYGLSRHQYLNA